MTTSDDLTGWWEASDGKLYPPEAQPDPRPAPPRAPVEVPERPLDAKTSPLPDASPAVGHHLIPPRQPAPKKKKPLDDQPEWVKAGAAVVIVFVALFMAGCAVLALVTLAGSDNNGCPPHQHKAEVGFGSYKSLECVGD